MAENRAVYEFEKQIEYFCYENSLLKQEDGVLAGLSGGADSVCLLILLKKLSEKIHFPLAACHVNHGIRGAEADKDEAFCRKLCEKLHVPLSVVHEDIPALARTYHLTEEEAGRKVRYESFSKLAGEYKLCRIAVAHNRNDQAETVLMHMMRGSGLKGACGMRPLNRYPGNRMPLLQPAQGATQAPQKNGELLLIRPLLDTSRQEIEAYLAALGQDYVTDSTNLAEEYSRNSVRLSLLPMMEEIMPGAVEHIAGFGRRLQPALDRAEGKGQQLFDKAEKKDTLLRISKSLYRAEDADARMHFLELVADFLKTGRKDITEKHLKAVDEIAAELKPASYSLPRGLYVQGRGSEMIFTTDITALEAMSEANVLVGEGFCAEICLNEADSDEHICFEDDRLVLKYRIFQRKNSDVFPNGIYTKWFDYDNIKGSLRLRTRKTGDVIVLRPDGTAQSIKKYMINRHIPEKIRNRVPMLVDEEGILWILGDRICERTKITESTARILELKLVIRTEEDYG